MPLPSLFPKFMNLLGGAAGGDNLVLTLLVEPDITLDPDIDIIIVSDIDITVDPEIEIELD